MKKIKTLIFVACLVSHFSAQAWQFKGYYIVNAAGNSEGGTQSCFQLSGALSKYRLGNDCVQYFEFGLRQEVARLEDGSTISVEGMTHHYNPIGHTPKFHDSNEYGGGWSRIAQMFVEWKGASLLNGGNFWVGRRFYNRNDILISDFFYWSQSGTGFGFDKVSIGNLRYSYVFSRKDNYWQESYINRHDFNVAGFKTNPGGELEVGLSYLQKPDSHDAHSGWALTVQHKQKKFLGGTNTIALQYGRGPGTALGYTGDPTLVQYQPTSCSSGGSCSQP